MMEGYVDIVDGVCKGVYLRKELADKNAKGTTYLVPIYGYRGSGWDHEFIEGECVYYNSEVNTIRELINCLYQLPDCGTAGLGHILIEDENYRDEDIAWTIEQCKMNPDKTEAGLVLLITEKLSKLTIQERAFFFNSYSTSGCCMHPECRDDCPLHKGETL